MLLASPIDTVHLWLLYAGERLAHQRRRANEAYAVRHCLVGLPGPAQVPVPEAELARGLRRLREQATDLFGQVTACATCAHGKPLPHGRYPGGFCCGGITRELFTEDELAALRLSGTRADDLKPPAGDQAGCVFRGPRGCSLPPAHRPNQCVRHLCFDLVQALHAAGRLEPVEDLVEELRQQFQRFVALRRSRLDDELLGL